MTQGYAAYYMCSTGVLPMGYVGFEMWCGWGKKMSTD